MNLLNHIIIVLLGLLSVTNLFAGEVVVQVDGNDPIERYAVARIQYAFAEHPAWPDMQVRFDLSDDMGEVSNIAGQLPHRHQEMYNEMLDYFMAVGARIPKMNPDYDSSVYEADKEYT